MNLPSNNSSCGMPPSNPCLRVTEPCLTHIWSRDHIWTLFDEASLQFVAFNEPSQPKSTGDDLNSLASSWDVALNIPGNDNNGKDLGSQSPLHTEFEDGQHISQPDTNEDYSGEQWYPNAGYEALDTLSQHVDWSDVDYQIDSGSHGIDTATASKHSHHQSDCDGKAVCNQCSQHFPHKSALNKHAKQTKHKAHACSCGVTFGRFDVLNRHLQKFNPKTFYPCLYCAKYTGMSAFTRQDHLTQHLRGYHKIEISTRRGVKS